MTKKVAVFITARTGSSRLPSKALMEIKGNPIVEHLIDWIKRAEKIDEIVLCTTDKIEDNILVEIAKKNGIGWFQGSENDIIARSLGAVEKYNIDFVINAECDAIFYEAKYIDAIAEMGRKDNVYDVISTIDLPNGVNIYGYKRESLQAVLEKSVETGWLELLYNDKNLNQGYVSIGKEYMTPARLTIDYPEDLEFFTALYNEFEGDFELRDIVSKLKKKPELMDINIRADNKYWANFAKKKLKFCIIGLGSMGKRRIRNLKALGIKNVVGFDISEERRKEVDIKTYNWKNVIKYEPDAFIICTPPKVHLWYQQRACYHGIDFFTEASVVSNGMDDLIKRVKESEFIGVPSSTLRYHPAIKQIKELIDTNKIGKPLAFTYHSGSFLPEWHPKDDPKNYYAYDKKQGAAKEIVPFELSWLTWIFGDVKSVKSYYKESMNWGIDDLYQVLIEFESGLIGHILVDVISRHDYRQLKILGSHGIINWDWDKKRVELLSKVRFRVSEILNNEIWDYYPYREGISIEGYNPNILEEMYIDELDHFIECILNIEQPNYTLEDDLKILKILEDIEKDGS